MSLTVADMDRVLAAIAKDYAEADAAGDKARMVALEKDYAEVEKFRDVAIVAANAPAAAAISAAAQRVNAIIGRLSDPLALIRFRRWADEAGVTLDRSPAAVPAAAPPPGAELPTEDSVLGVMPEAPPVAAMDTPDPPSPGGPSRYVHARRTGDRCMTCTDDAGRSFQRIGGSRSWRNCNPGNIRKGSFASSCGAIGDDGAFAAFPDPETGAAALETLLRGRSFGPLSLADAIARYAPREDNDTDRYLALVAEGSGVARDAVLDDLKIPDIRRIVRAIKEMEGWREGTETPNVPASSLASGAPGGTGGVSAAVGAAAEWMDVALAEEADPPREIPGAGLHPRILDYLRVGAAWVERTDDPVWCAGFVNFCLSCAGHPGTEHPGARSFFWNRANQFVKLPGPRLNCIGVIRRAPFSATAFHDDRWESGAGLVGFVVAHDAGSATLLGGHASTIARTRHPRDVPFGGGTVDPFAAFLMPAMG